MKTWGDDMTVLFGEEKDKILDCMVTPCVTCGESFPILTMWYDDKNPKPYTFWCDRCVKFEQGTIGH